MLHDINKDGFSKPTVYINYSHNLFTQKHRELLTDTLTTSASAHSHIITVNIIHILLLTILCFYAVVQIYNAWHSGANASKGWG